jgi:exonuclease SbcC
MRLHRLEVTAFGPFAASERVDFDALASSGLFLFTGATGAGKTSILDAVCFALYGDVPGARHNSRSLRSDHAVDGVRTEVVLEVSLRGRRLRITRSPQWDRLKRRGTGVTTEPARVHLEECGTAGWTTLSTRLEETGQLVVGLLGLSLTQFCQVVLLPQGQFAEFLRAGAEKRRELLESLFDTGRFTNVERWLVARRQESYRVLDEADQQVAHVLARIAEAAGVEVPDDVEPTHAPDWVAELLEVARVARDATFATETLAAARHDRAIASVEAATVVAEAHLRRTALHARLVELTEAAPAHSAAAVAVEAARAVAPLIPLVAEVARLQVELEEARSVAAAAGLQLSAALKATGTDAGAVFSLPLPAPGSLQALARDHRDEVGGLRALGKDEAEADLLTTATAGLEQRVVELDSRSERLAAELEAAPARRAELEAARDRSQAAAAGLPGAVTAAETAAVRLAAAQERDALVLRKVAATDQLRTCTDVAQTARDRWLGLRQSRLDGMAAELAQSLVSGAECPVCGSAEHPRPAVVAADAVSRDEEDAAAEFLETAERDRASATESVAALEATLAAARSAAGGDNPVDDLRATHDSALAEVERLTVLAGNVRADAAALAGFGAQHEGLLQERVSLDQDAKNLRAQVAADTERLHRVRAALDLARGDDPSIAARAARLARIAEDLEALAAQVGVVEQLGDQVAAALQRAERAALKRGLTSVEDVAMMARDDEEVARLDEARRHHDGELASVRQQLGEPALTALGDSPAPDLQVLREQMAELQAVRAGAGAAAATAAARFESLSRLASALDEVLARRGPLAEHHHTVDGLSRLAEGKSADNRLRMSLSGYVLAARLEQVAVSASQRLALMSSGRYQLVHTAEAGSARARGGLHLRVLDAWTGVERDPTSLSGGESFAASLALALGLADVVTAEAGGSLLETLFVDEGFGSLDEETLDEVMGVMDGLRDGGRVVGIVSHVAELRQRIPVQLCVLKSRTGSSVQQ